MKKLILLFSFCILGFTLSAQTIYQKDKWGEKLFYIEGNVLKIKDKWGKPIYYFDGQSIRIKDKWGKHFTI